MITFRATNDLVFVKEDKPKEKTKGGIFIPQSVKQNEKTTVGVVVTVGPGERTKTTGERIKPEVKVGDKVIFDTRAPYKMKIYGTDYLCMKLEHIMGIIED